ncbi:hypothetical protein BT96DRAFT_947894 [Gymnopus androsaceus JB14]|uniref:Uncharacterized protein n=1 Tax=Gymnopus androsaceus JB14 TaxID=1447944 RepID=A0A6A4GRQ9_9AGAR|nr:hypothetical protein BT96DRAFT_947894 [Gymnopus androsaceus JB14]
MPRLRTESAIRKSERTKRAKQEVKQRKAKRASQRYRLKNKERLNAEAAERMARNHSKMSYEEKEAFKERKKAAAKKYYLKNREAILKKADDKRWRAYVKVHGEVGWWTYRPRKGKVRVGLLGQPDDNQEDNEEVEEIQVWPYERRIIK